MKTQWRVRHSTHEIFFWRLGSTLKRKEIRSVSSEARSHSFPQMIAWPVEQEPNLWQMRTGTSVQSPHNLKCLPAEEQAWGQSKWILTPLHAQQLSCSLRSVEVTKSLERILSDKRTLMAVEVACLSLVKTFKSPEEMEMMTWVNGRVRKRVGKETTNCLGRMGRKS